MTSGGYYNSLLKFCIILEYLISYVSINTIIISKTRVIIVFSLTFITSGYYTAISWFSALLQKFINIPLKVFFLIFCFYRCNKNTTDITICWQQFVFINSPSAGDKNMQRFEVGSYITQIYTFKFLTLLCLMS